MIDLVIEAGGFKGLMKFNYASIEVRDRRMDRVPPLAPDCAISLRSNEQSVPLAVQSRPQ